MSKTDFEKKIQVFCVKNKLLEKGQKVLVCLSGGADSVCLLRVMSELKEEFGIKIEAAHVNHMLRAVAVNQDI